MADYPGICINNIAVSIGNLKLLSSFIGNSNLSQGVNRSFGKIAQTSIVTSGLNKSLGRIIYSQFKNVLPLSKIYFNNGFSQDSVNIYLSKAALGLPAGLNLSYEAFLIALIIQWANNIGLGSESKVQAQWLSYGDIDDGYIYFTIQIIFRKAVTVVDTYEMQPIYSISPLDF